LAANKAGLDVVAAIELNKNACNTYRTNLAKRKTTTLYQGDILEIDSVKFREAHFPSGVECDVVLGGPPCQGFSVHRINDAGINDPRNELIHRYFQFVTELQPKVFLMENVPGILWARHKDYLEAFYSRGRAAGYQIEDPVVLDARDFGVPQRRKRVFILGIRSDLNLSIEWPPLPTHTGVPTKELGLKPWKSASTVLNRPIKAGDVNNIHMNHTSELVEVFRSTPPNGGSRSQSSRVLACHLAHNGHKDVYGRINPSEPAPTMTTACINPSKGRFLHPTEHHGITVRHAARFQTFPDWFVFSGGLIASGEQIGNAVPIKLGFELLSRIVESLKNAVKAREN
jgi:DNA (cytosine-5)-methyltransferase 1